MEKKKTHSTPYIGVEAIVAQGKEVAELIASGYESVEGEQKISFALELLSKEVHEKIKIKFVADVFTRPKHQRIKIASDIRKSLEHA